MLRCRGAGNHGEIAVAGLSALEEVTALAQARCPNWQELLGTAVRKSQARTRLFHSSYDEFLLIFHCVLGPVLASDNFHVNKPPRPLSSQSLRSNLGEGNKHIFK